MKKTTGFIYIWRDNKRKKYYIGSHLGNPEDGYVGSNKRLQTAFRSRPHTFSRKILEMYEEITSKDLLVREQLWLSMIKPEELTVRYYNEKKVASGGDIISNLPEHKKKEHARKSSMASQKFWNNITTEEREKRVKNAFGGNNFSRDYLSKRNKELCSRIAVLTFPNGETKEITNIAEFCRVNNLNYGNMKTVLRQGRKSCSGFRGYYK